jgi:hypothetical protein
MTTTAVIAPTMRLVLVVMGVSGCPNK